MGLVKWEEFCGLDSQGFNFDEFKSGEVHEKHVVSTSGCESDDSIGLNMEVN
jgi:hypothetical protein